MQNSILPVVALGRSIIDSFARKSGWLQRSGSDTALTPGIFIQALVASVACGHRSFRELAIEVGLLSGKTISKQGLSKRINAQSVELFKQVTAEALRRSAFSATQLSGQISKVGRILVGDSSTVALHSSLAEHFPGATNHTEATAAQVRIQLTFDLLGGRWLQADLDAYRRNDQRAALDIVGTIIQAGDLIIRDLGYASVRCFRAIREKQAYFLSRLASNIGVFEPDGEALDILKLARTYAPRPGDTFTKRVGISASEHFNCRIVIIRVPQEIGDKRRRQLNERARRRGNKAHSKKYLALQDWMIFVTNLDEDQVTDLQLHELYQLRWRIENIFKLSKSHTALLRVAGHRTNKHHAELMIWSWLLMMITLSAQGIFRLWERGVGAIEESIFKSISKVLLWVTLSIELACAGSATELMERLIYQQQYHDRYEKRGRVSLAQRLTMALQPHPADLLS